MLEEILLGLSKLQIISYAALILAILSVAIIALKNKMGDKSKKMGFILMAVVIVPVTVYLDASIIYANLNSVTHGPVHWHASIEFLICGNKFELAHREIAVDKPLHTHGDGLIHVETTPISWEDVQLRKFFGYIGGSFTKTSLSLPSDSGTINVKNGDLCRGKPSTIKMVVNGKLEPKMDEYVVSPVEAGDIDKILIVAD